MQALEEGLTCQQICDKYHAEHRGIYEWFQISFDHFGRTPTWQQTEIAQARLPSVCLRCSSMRLLWLTQHTRCRAYSSGLRQQGRLKEQTTQQLFSEAANTFLADRFVSGTCPFPDCAL